MPPFILQDAVDRISDKMTVKIDASILDKTREKLRILETRIRIGMLGKADRKESRAACVLESVYSQEKGTRLPWKELCAAVGMKKANLEQLQGLISNYLQPRRVIQQSTGRIMDSRKRPLSQQQSQRRSSRVAYASAEPSTALVQSNSASGRLDALAIRLSVHLMDPHGSCQRTRQLLNDIRNYIETDSSLSVSERRGMRYDMSRYEAAYEAAALYYVTCDAKQKTMNEKPKSSDDQDGQRELSLHDLADASTEFRYLELREVLPHVIELGDKITAENEAKKVQVLVDGKDSRDLQKADGGNGDVPLKDSADTVLEDTIAEHTMAAEEEQRFATWQEEVLQVAILEAKESKSGEGESSAEIPDADALALAADMILRKHGLLA